ncbi:ATP-binding protein [Acidovorax cavernicola]|uniref:histidine kinase n=1 Tax=Acidovorax cavernicola TaxID=1675792 RepID=A0A9X8D5B6_9BURK|nr:ATP-binding protein [Acidovorax cavernicola]RIX80542.1 PAS domain S-box protein [Acidovorax cavernicola]
MADEALDVPAPPPPPQQRQRPAWVVAFARLRSLWQRWFLWLLLAVLVSALLVTVVWLAGRHEIEQVQAALERDTADAVVDLRSGLQRNAQSLRATLAPGMERAHWADRAAAQLREHREWLRLEWRDAELQPIEAVNTPYRMRLLEENTRGPAQADVVQACATARKAGAPAYSPSHYVPVAGGGGVEVMELCLPMDAGDYLVASYSLRDTLIELVGPTLTRGQEVAFTEADGTRLVALGTSRRIGTRVFTSQQRIELPGASLMLRVDGWRAAPDLFPNMLTALVTAISIALVSVLILLARDTRRRLRAERGLADALAFRKAMEDSVVTGLRARDLQGRITYVNPAFCEMVGFTPEELMADSVEAPYWPTELAHEYHLRQTRRFAGGLPPREGFESVFMRKDGTRFPVLIFEAPLINAHKVQTGWMSAFLDLSEQRRIEELSRASQERLQASARLATVGEMASLLSHELTQPLAAIASYATGSLNLIGPDARGEQAEVAMAVKRIAEQADRAGQVIRSVHDFVRRRDRMREAVAPQALIDAVLPLVRLQARKLDVTIELVFEERLPAVVCDRTLVEQVLLNLARNAMQAMDGGDHGPGSRVLRLRVARALPVGATAVPADGRRWLEFSVADMGCGISDEVAARLFTPFFTTRPDGMGLGLSLCRTVVEQHGGALVFEPNKPRGTVFRFTLPSA